MQPGSGALLYSMIDINSFIDYFLIGELSRNVDAYKKSAYFYKEKDSQGGKLFAGPVWDFDWAWKNIRECYFGSTNGSGWAYQVHQCNPWPVPPTWMTRLLEDQYFAQHLNARYTELRQSYLSEDFIFGYIDSVASVLDVAQQRHYEQWKILGINVGTPEVDPQPVTYAGEIEKFKTWISKRLLWLDANMPGFVVTDLNNTFPESEFVIFPNPVTNKLTIRSREVIKSIEIYSMNGRIKLLKEVNAKSIIVSTQDLSQGMYFVRTLREDGTQWTNKFIKNN